MEKLQYWDIFGNAKKKKMENDIWNKIYVHISLAYALTKTLWVFSIFADGKHTNKNTDGNGM